MKIERLPLNALRAFAEAARAESFKQAAAHLGVTPGAISRQVKQLEDRLGVPLFARHASGVRLNEVGRQLAREIDGGLERIAAGVLTAQERAGDDHVDANPAYHCAYGVFSTLYWV